MILPQLQVDKGAIRFVLSGANIMCPGLTSPGAKMDVDLPPDTIVVSSHVHMFFTLCVCVCVCVCMCVCVCVYQILVNQRCGVDQAKISGGQFISLASC